MATKGVYYTAKGADVYAHVLHWPEGNVLALHGKSSKSLLVMPGSVLTGCVCVYAVPVVTSATKVTMVGCAREMAWKKSAAAAGVEVTIPMMAPTELPSLHGPWVFKLTRVH